ncbi:hypothetical protein EMCRGX_G028559 [Ephydatia muelleri]
MTDNEDERREFSSVEEELEYWKDKAMEYRQNLEEVRNEFDDYQESSRELEAELEAQLEQAERKNKDLMSSLQKTEEENEALKVKLEAQQHESYVTITTLQEERAEQLALKENMQKYIRELEQTNDDLERGKRATVSSLEDFEGKLNQAFERNAILENELDEKERLAVMCQRLKDEVRDLHQEFSTRHKKPLDVPSSPHAAPADGSKSEPPAASSAPSAAQSAGLAPGTPQNFTPSTRVSALNMVGDLLRKVGALESRLASCRTHISKDKESNRIPRTVLTPSVRGKIPARHNAGDQQQTVPANLTKITV